MYIIVRSMHSQKYQLNPKCYKKPLDIKDLSNPSMLTEKKENSKSYTKYVFFLILYFYTNIYSNYNLLLYSIVLLQLQLIEQNATLFCNDFSCWFFRKNIFHDNNWTVLMNILMLYDQNKYKTIKCISTDT